jgi:hypothetical protein
MLLTPHGYFRHCDFPGISQSVTVYNRQIALKSHKHNIQFSFARNRILAAVVKADCPLFEV